MDLEADAATRFADTAVERIRMARVLCLSCALLSPPSQPRYQELARQAEDEMIKLLQDLNEGRQHSTSSGHLDQLVRELLLRFGECKALQHVSLSALCL
jgi:hypothetical protein